MDTLEETKIVMKTLNSSWKWGELSLWFSSIGIPENEVNDAISVLVEAILDSAKRSYEQG